MKDLEQQLQGLHTAVPVPKKEKELRERLVSRIRFYQFSQSRESALKLSFIEFLNYLVHPRRFARSFGTVTLMFAFVFVFGFGSAFASTINARPGDALYDVKITVERMPLVVLSGQVRVEKELAWAEDHQNEIVHIVNSAESNEIKSKKIQAITKHLSKNLNEAEKGMQKLSEDSSGKLVVAVAHTVKESVTGIKESLDEVARVVEEEGIDGGTTEEILKVTIDAASAELATLGVLIDATRDVPSVTLVNATSTEEDGVEEMVHASTTKNSIEDVTDDIVFEENHVNASSSETVIEEVLGMDVLLLGAIQELDTWINGNTTVENLTTTDVILNIDEIVEEETVDGEAENVRNKVKRLVENAQEKLEKGDIKGAWVDIDSAWEIFENN